MNQLIKMDEEYRKWIEDIGKRYKQRQIKASVSVNQEMIVFHNLWEIYRIKNCFRFRGDIIELSLINVNWTGKINIFCEENDFK